MSVGKVRIHAEEETGCWRRNGVENRVAALETAMQKEAEGGIARVSVNPKKRKRMDIAGDTKERGGSFAEESERKQKDPQQKNQQMRTALCHESQRLPLFSKGCLRQHKFLGPRTSWSRLHSTHSIEPHTAETLQTFLFLLPFSRMTVSPFSSSELQLAA